MGLLVGNRAFCGYLLGKGRYPYYPLYSYLHRGDNCYPKQEVDGSHTIIFNGGGWNFHDNYFGGEQGVHRKGSLTDFI